MPLLVAQTGKFVNIHYWCRCDILTGFKKFFSLILLKTGKATVWIKTLSINHSSRHDSCPVPGELSSALLQPRFGLLTFLRWAKAPVLDDQNMVCNKADEYLVPGVWIHPVALKHGVTFGSHKNFNFEPQEVFRESVTKGENKSKTIL